MSMSKHKNIVEEYISFVDFNYLWIVMPLIDAGSVVDVGPRDSLTWADIRLMLKGNRALFDPFGATAAILEWGGLFWLAAQRRACDGRFVVTRERARAAADGTLFAVLKADRELAMADAKKKKEEVGGRSRGGGGKAATTPATAAKKRSSPAEAGGAPPSSSAGKGIPAEKLQHIFDVGFRSTGERVKMGFGLATDYRIIQDHHGEIRIESEIGKGTQVTVLLPIDSNATTPSSA